MHMMSSRLLLPVLLHHEKDSTHQDRCTCMVILLFTIGVSSTSLSYLRRYKIDDATTHRPLTYLTFTRQKANGNVNGSEILPL